MGGGKRTDFSPSHAAAALSHVAGMAAEGDVPDDDEQERCCAHELSNYRLAAFAQ